MESQNAVLEPEVMPAESPKTEAPAETLAIVQSTGVSPSTAQTLQASFAGLFTAAKAVAERSRAIVVTDVSQKLEMKLARECRLELKRIRNEADKTRKTLKEDSLRRGKAIDGFFNILADLTGAEEKRLEEQENFAQRKDEERKAALKLARETELTALGFDCRFTDVLNMPEADYAALLENARGLKAAKEAAEAKAAADKEAARKAAAEERERREAEAKRMAEENARMKLEAEQREAAIKAERERADVERREMEAKIQREQAAAAAKAKAERDALEAKAKAEAEKARKDAEEALRQERLRLQALADVERQKAAAAQAERDRVEAVAKAQRELAERQEAERAEAARNAASAPDREKLMAVAAALRVFPTPDMATDAGQAVRLRVISALMKLATKIEGEAFGL